MFLVISKMFITWNIPRERSFNDKWLKSIMFTCLVYFYTMFSCITFLLDYNTLFSMQHHYSRFCVCFIYMIYWTSTENITRCIEQVLKISSMFVWNRHSFLFHTNIDDYIIGITFHLPPLRCKRSPMRAVFRVSSTRCGITWHMFCTFQMMHGGLSRHLFFSWYFFQIKLIKIKQSCRCFLTVWNFLRY